MWVCSFQLLMGIASAAFLRSEFHGTHEHILLSIFLGLPQHGGPGSCIYFPPFIPFNVFLHFLYTAAYEPSIVQSSAEEVFS
jgi:hypothetical protein